jgi:twitching motility protein PilT
MQTFNQSLATLYFKKHITLEVAISMTSNPDELNEMINRGVGLIYAPTPVGGPATRRAVERR